MLLEFHHLNVISAKVTVAVDYISVLHVGKKWRSYEGVLLLLGVLDDKVGKRTE